MKAASGKFVLRLPPKLHQQLRRESRRLDLSLNQYCHSLIANSLGHATFEQSSPYAPLLEALTRRWKENLLGVLLFGSRARGDYSSESDTDLLIVLSPDTKIERELYTEWDKISESVSCRNLSPQFVSLPREAFDAGGIWFEVALEGEIIWEQDKKLTRFLQELRGLIASGRVQRRFTHGHPYWKKIEDIK